MIVCLAMMMTSKTTNSCKFLKQTFIQIIFQLYQKESSEQIRSSDEIQIQDAYYYADENKIISTWTKITSVAGRVIYKTPLEISATQDVTLEFKFKSISTIYNTMSSVVGVDLTRGTTFDHRMGVISTYNDVSSYYSSSSSYRNKIGDATSLTTNSVYKIVLTNGTAKWYRDDVQFASYSIEPTSTSALRYDIFNTNTSHLEYLKIIL